MTMTTTKSRGIRTQPVPLSWLKHCLDIPADGVVLSAYVIEGNLMVSIASEEYTPLPADACLGDDWDGNTA